LNKYKAQVLIGRTELIGLNNKRFEDILESAQKSYTVVMPFSRTGNMASRIIDTHFKILQLRSYLENYQYSIITAYTKHKSLSGYLVSSKYLKINRMSPEDLEKLITNTTSVKRQSPETQKSQPTVNMLVK